MLDLEQLSMTAVKNEFKVCESCRGSNLETLVPRLRKIDGEAAIKIGCHSYCGPGRDFPFVFINNKPIYAENEDDLIQKVDKIVNV